MSVPARRGLLAAVGGVALAAASPITAANPDAALIGWCERLIRHMADYEALGHLPDEEADERRAALDGLENEALDAILDTPATSPTGIAAKARAILRWGYYRERDDETNAEMAEGLCRDLLAGDRHFLATLDADHAARRAWWEAARVRAANRPPPPPPEPYRDTRTPQQKVDGAKFWLRAAEEMLREAEAELAAGVVPA